MRRLILSSITVILLAPGLLATSCDKKGKEPDGPVLAKVNDRTITPEDFAISIDLLYPPEERAQWATPEGKNTFLQQLIVMELFYQEGVAQGIEEDPRFKQIIESYKRYLVYDTLMNRGVNESTMVGYFKENFVHVAIIFMKKPEKATEEQIAKVKAKIEKLREDLLKGADFKEAAKKYSEHPSAEFGGDLGAITRSTPWEPQMIDAALALTEESRLSAVVESPAGFYIIYLVEPVGKVPLDYLLPDVRRAIYSYLLQQNYAMYAAQLQSSAQVDTNLELLKDIRLDQLTGPEGALIKPIPQEGVPGVDPMASPP